MTTNKKVIAESEEITEITAAQQTRLAALKELGQDLIKANKAYAEAKASGNVERADKLKIMISRLAAQKMQLGEDDSNVTESDDGDWGTDPFEAHGIRGMKRTAWRKIFKNGKQAAAWCEKYDAEILGMREVDPSELPASMRPKQPKEWSMKESEVRAISALEGEEVELGEAGGESFDKPYGVRWKVFAGREGRLATKEKFFKTQKQMDAFTDKLVLTDGFYEIDSWCFPPEANVTEDDVTEAFKKENPNSQERTDRSRAGVQIKTPEGTGVIVAEYKVPTFSASVPFKRTVRVKLDDGSTKEFDYKACKVLASVAEDEEPNGGRHRGTDTVEMTIPLFIRCLEWAKEDAPDDVALHVFAENAIKIEGVLDVSDYDALLPATEGEVTEGEEQIDEISPAAKSRLLTARINRRNDSPEDDMKATRTKVALANRAAKKVGAPSIDMSKQIHIGEASDPQDLAAKPTWQLEDDLQYLKPQKWQPSAAEEIQAIEAELARRAQSDNSVNEDATAGASCSSAIAVGAVGPLTKTPIKRTVPKKSVKKESVTEEAITELDNGPKGRVATDKISYDARRSSAVGVSHAGKSDMAARKAADSAAAEKARAEAAKNRRQSSRAQERQWALEDAREEPIEIGQNFDFEDLKKMAADYAGAHDIVEIQGVRKYRIRKDDAIVAAIEVSVYCQYDPADFGYDEETAASMGGGLSDSIRLRFARDPKNPKKIVFRGFGT